MHLCFPKMDQLPTGDFYDCLGHFPAQIFPDSKTITGDPLHWHWWKLVPGKFSILLQGLAMES